MAERIGAQHADVETTGRSFDLAGQIAQVTGADATGYAGEMEAGLDEITTLLSGHFEQLAGELRQKVADHRARLEATDWQGASKDNANAAEQALNGEVDRVLEVALEETGRFRTALHAQAESFRSVIEGEFRAAMQATDADYQQLANASRQFVHNLQQADATIRYGG